MKKVKNPIISANECNVIIDGHPFSIEMSLFLIIETLRENEVMSKDEIHELIDVAYMTEEELEKTLNKKEKDMLKMIKAFISNEEDK